MQRRRQHPQARYGQRHQAIPQDGVNRGGMEWNAGPRSQPANPRARMYVANPDGVGCGPAVAATLYEAAQPTHRLSPWAAKGEGCEYTPGLAPERRSKDRARGAAEQAAIETKRPQQLG